nr:hypothetical protein [Tanacetum cinerariifolium]
MFISTEYSLFVCYCAKRPSHSSVVGPSRKRSRSPTTSVPRSSPILGALSLVRADLLPPPKRIRNSNFLTNLEDRLDEIFESSIPRETGLRDDVVARDALRARGIDARVVVEAVDREESEMASAALCRRFMILAPKKPIPRGRPYRYHADTPDDYEEEGWAAAYSSS